MSLGYAVGKLTSRMAEWSRFPKYQLERRVDIFLTPFLEGFLSWRLDGEARLVAPEFPLPRRLSAAPGETVKEDAKTVNVDYLLHVSRARPEDSAWIFLELKTDIGSFRTEQDRAYRRARDEVGMRALRKELGKIMKASKKHAAKYLHLIEHLEQLNFDEDKIELVYLTPAPVDGFPSAEKIPVTYIGLTEFAAQPVDRIAEEYRALWPFVRDLLLSISPRRRARRRTRNGG